MAQTVIIQIQGQDDLTKVAQGAAKSLSALGGAVGSAAGAANGATGLFGKLASGLGGVMTVAGGIVTANLFGKLADGVLGFAKTGLEAVGAQQQLEASLKALLTSNAMYATSTETVTTAVTKQLMTQDEYAQKLDELNAKLNTQKATYQEQQEKIRQLTAVYGENGLNVLKLKAQHEQLAVSIQGTEQDITGLSTSTTQYSTDSRQVYKQVMDQAQAFKIASKQTRDLLDFVSRLAVVSPFETEDVELTTKYAIAAGMGVDSTKEFVPAFLDLAGAVGITSDSLGFAADQLFQVKKIGKLTEIDLRQLRRLGIDLAKVIGVEMGMSVDEFNAAAEKSPEIFDQLFNAITHFSQNTFAGTSKEMATSVKGLQSTISDIFVIGARTFFRPLVDAVTPAFSKMISSISDLVLGGSLEGIGQQFATMVVTGITKGFTELTTLWAVFNNSFESGLRLLGYKAEKILGPIVAQIGGYLQSQWQNTVLPALTAWGNQFWDWTKQTYANLPGILTGLVQGIATFLTDNWPTISAALMEWTPKVWDWVKTAAAGAGAALSALGLALLAWATSGEAQAATRELGQKLGVMITDALKLGFEGGKGAAGIPAALGSLVSGLLNAVTGIAGTLIILGGELVAGILSGILKSFGVDLQPATFNELSTILTGIGTDIATIAGYVGEQIVTGIANALGTSTETVRQALINMMTGGLAGLYNLLGISSPSTVFFDIGINLIQGLIDGIASMGGALLGKMTELLGGLFGGGGEQQGPALAMDPTQMLDGLSQVQIAFNALVLSFTNFTTATLTTLNAVFTATATAILAQLATLLAEGIMPVDAALVVMYSATLPTLQSVAQATAQAIVGSFTTVQSLLTAVNSTIARMTSLFGQLASAAISAGDGIKKGMEKAADAIENLIDIVRAATKEFDKMAAAAKKAADNAKSAGSSSGAAGGLGFAGGTGALGFKVPSGFPNDSFPIRVQSGERVLVAPAGQSIERLVGARNQSPLLVNGGDTNNYNTIYYIDNITVNSQATEDSILADLESLQDLIPGGT